MWHRFGSLGLALLLGSFMLALLAVATRQAAAAALPAPATNRTYPGASPCNTSLQHCIDNSTGVITISAGTYITSVTLNTAVSLVGVNSATTILRALPNQRVITITGATIGSATIISGLTFAGGNVLGAACPAGCGGAIQITGSARPLLQNLVISNSTAQQLGGGLYADPGSPMTLTNVTVISNTSAHNSGGGLYAGDALTLTNLTVINNLAPNGAGGGVRASSSVVIQGGRFENNHSSNHGGAMRVTGALNVNNGAFLSNTAGIVLPAGGIDGGAVRADSAVLLVGTTFSNNSASNDGGALYAVGSLQGFGLTVISNTAAHDGGGLYGELTADISGLWSDNRALAGSGGAIYARGFSDYDLVKFIANLAGSNGGGSFSGADASSNGANYFQNSAGGSGGGLFAAGNASFNGGELFTNTANVGGGAFVQGNASMGGVNFQDNQAQQDAGGLFVGLNATLFGATFDSNKAPNGIGGGIVVSGNISGIGPTAMQNEARNGGGAYVTGTVDLNFPQFVLNVAHLSLGGGLFVHGSAAITDGTFLSNTAENHSMLSLSGAAPELPSSGRPGGGGLFANQSVTLTNNLFQGNQATLDGVGGGALVNGENTSHSTHDQFIGNLAGTFGGGLQADGPMIIQADVFSSNIAGNVAALDLAGTVYTVANSLFVNNIVTGSVAPVAVGINVEASGPILLINDTLANATRASQPALLSKTGPLFVTDTIVSGYSIAMTGTGITEDDNLFFDNGANAPAAVHGGHSLVADPLFANPAAGNFHLTLASPARDAGVDVGLRVDFDGDPRPVGAGFDIGFDEFALSHKLFLPLLMR